MEDRLDADAVARVLRRAQQLADERGTTPDPALELGGVSPDALLAAADEVGIDPAAVRESLALERFTRGEPDHRRLDRLVGAADVVVQRTIARSVDDTLEAVQDWLAMGHQMRCIRTSDTTIECRPSTGLGASLRRAATEFTADENIHPVDRIVVEAHSPGDPSAGEPPVTVVRITAIRRSTRARHLGGAAAGGAGGVGVAVAGVLAPFALWPLASAGLVAGGVLIARSSTTHADRVEVEMVHVLSGVAAGERPSGLTGRAVRRVRNAVNSVRSSPR